MELKISNLMDCISDDSIELSAKYAVSSERVKKLTLNKINMRERSENSFTGKKQAQHYYCEHPKRTHTHIVRRTVLIAASLVMLLLGSITALAKGGVININEFYNSIFFNPDAKNHIATADALSGTVVDNGIEITPLGAYIEGHNAYIRLKLRDIEGGHLSNTIYFLNKNGESIPAVVDYDSSTNSAIAIIQEDIATGEAASATTSLQLAAICTDIQELENLSLDFNIGAHIGITQPVVLKNAEFLTITGVETQDGTLAIHYRDNDIAKYGWSTGLFGLRTPDGTIIWETSGVLYDTGNKTIYFDIGKHDINTLSLVFSGKHAIRTITGDWKIAFSTVQQIASKTLTASYSERKAEITCGATELEINLSPGYTDGDLELNNIIKSLSDTSEVLSKNGEKTYPVKDVSVSRDISIALKDGKIVYPRFISASWDSKSANFKFKMNFVLPENIQNVTFFGKTFTFTD